MMALVGVTGDGDGAGGRGRGWWRWWLRLILLVAVVGVHLDGGEPVLVRVDGFVAWRWGPTFY